MKLSRLFICLLVHTCIISSSYTNAINETQNKKEVHQTKGLGKHLIIELYDCDLEAMNNVKAITEMMLEAVRAAGGNIVTHFMHQFSPYGCSGVVVIAESHLTIHTWPEYGYCALDIFTCGDLDNDAAFEIIKNNLKPKNFSRIEMKRGILS